MASAEDLPPGGETTEGQVLGTTSEEKILDGQDGTLEEQPGVEEAPAAEAPMDEEPVEVAPAEPAPAAEQKAAPRGPDTGSGPLIGAVDAAVAQLVQIAAITIGELATATYDPADEQGANDEPGQKDLTKLWSWSPSNGTLKIGWNWDETAWEGDNTGDACALFDTDDDTYADFAVCVTVGEDPAVQLDASPRVYTCAPAKSTTRCFDATIVPNATTDCDVDQTATNPFDGGDDTTAVCTVNLGEVGGALESTLTNVCSYPSQIPNSDPSDCVLAPRDGKLTVVKVATPADTGQEFTFRLETKGVQELFATLESGESETSGVASGQVIKLTEDELAEWNLDRAECDNEQDPGALTLKSGEHVTCTFYNSKTRYADLTVKKTATTSYDRDYDWTITKGVDGESKKYDADGTASFDYDVVVTPGAPQDSDFKVQGVITVSNPNTAAFAGVSLTDKLDGEACTITNLDGSAFTQPFSIPAGGTVEVKYVCDLPDGSSDAAGTNEATATWQAGDYYGTDGSASGAAGYDFADAKVTTTDETVTVTDNQFDLSELPGGNQVTAPAIGSFPYSIEYTSTDTGACKSFKNVASITDDGQPKTDDATVEICKGADLAVSKNVIASLTRTYAWDIVKDRQGESKVYVDPKTGKATVNYSVVLSAGMGNDSEWLMTGTITVQNPNDWTVSLTGVTDVYPTMSCSLVPAPAGADLVIPADGSQDYDYACTSQTKPDYDGTNTATAAWNATAAGTPKGSAEKKVTVVEADWNKKLVNDKVMVVDDGAGKDDPQQWGPFTWESDWVSDPIRYSLELPGKPGECVPYRNTATVFAAKQAAGGYVADTTKALTSHYADVEVCWPMDMNIDKSVNASYGLQYHWQIDKSVDKTKVELTDGGDAKFTYTVKAVPSGSSTSGYAMSGTITVKNPYPQGGPSVTATVTDTTTVGGGATCSVTGGQSVSLAAGESKTLSYGCTFTSQPSSSGTNTATILWVGPDGKPDEAKVTVPVSFRATGAGNSTVTVTDNLASPSTLGTATWNASGTPTVFTYSLTHKGVDNTCVDYTNTATITQTGQSDSQVVTVCDQGDLVVTKSAEATYDRTYEWEITKVADRDRLDTEQGEPGTVNYTVGVTPVSYVDSGWEMTGVVTVLNPNAYKDVTIELTDVPDLGEGASCVFDENADFLVEAGETRTFTYTCSFEKQPAYDGSNTVIVDWGAGEVSTTTDVEFELDETTDEIVTVTDDMVEPSELGTVTWDENGKTVEFEYALEHEGRPDVCETVTNTATIVETGQAAQADVLVCGPEILPAEEEVPPKPRPPAILPETGAQAGLGLWTTLGGLMVALGVALLALRRRNAS